uniref:Transposase n=1 Tax=Haemonchus contortus TaxID=6289 RepID=A0A7I4YL73_HAECO
MSTQPASQRAVGRTIFSISLYRQAQKGIRSSELCQRTKIRGTVEYAKMSKIRWHVMRYRPLGQAVTDWIPRDVKRTPARWSDFFTKALNERNDNSVSLERVLFIGLIWLVTGTNGDVTGARLRISTINGATGDTGEVIHYDRINERSCMMCDV